MKIGIITFHWGTNYGAILQAYSLQTYLKKCGHEVFIIDYKPHKFDRNLFKIMTSRAIFNIGDSIKNLSKEKELAKFRKKYLCLTKRYKSLVELKNDPPQCDIYISGSDQVLNPSFTLYGEGKKSPASTYYLDFGDKLTKRFGYAVSFGCTEYPEKAKQIAQPLLKNFDVIGVRENSGIDILNSMAYTNAQVVPDPTLLLENSDFDALLETHSLSEVECFVYMLHNKKLAVKKLKQMYPNCIVADTNNEYSLPAWISNVKHANFVLTNSFHGVVFCLHYHVPFIVILESKAKTGMNDRFYTLLDSMKLTNRIIEETEYDEINKLNNKEINWNAVDNELDIIKMKGVDFLKEVLSYE